MLLRQEKTDIVELRLRGDPNTKSDSQDFEQKFRIEKRLAYSGVEVILGLIEDDYRNLYRISERGMMEKQ